MKLYAIIEVNDDMYDEFKEWYIRGDDLEIRYVEGHAYRYYEAIATNLLKLKPIPQKNKYDVEQYATVDYENKVTLGHFMNRGWNDCIDELVGDEE